MSLISMSAQAALLITVIILLRALCGHRLPRQAYQALWLVALLRLLLPFSIPSPFSIYNLAPRQPTGTVWIPTQSIASDSPVLPIEVLPHLPSAAPTLPLREIIWMTGMLLAAGYFLYTHLRWRKIYAHALPFSFVKINGRKVSIRVSEHVEAPLTYGVLRPVVLLPHSLIGQETSLCYALAHELHHVRHLDALKKWLLMAAVCIHWFNPLVWAMNMLACRDMELACDASVLRAFGADARKAYATLLLDMEETRSQSMALASHFGKNAIEERIVSIMKYKKTSLASIVLAVMLVAFTATAFATTAQDNTPANSPQPYVTASYSTEAKLITSFFTPYVPYGLKIDKDNNCLWYEDQLVRYVMDEKESKCFLLKYPAGTVDVIALRDTNGRLTGLRMADPAEFAQRTRDLENSKDFSWADGLTPAYCRDLREYPLELKPLLWTAEEYEANINELLPLLQSRVGTLVSEDWGYWTQEDMDMMILHTNETLERLRNGEVIYKALSMEEEDGILPD